MLTSSYPGVLTDLLYTQAKEFMGIFDPALGWFTQVNAAGVRLLGYESEPAFLADAEKAQLELNPVSGEEVQKLVVDIYRTPPDVARKAGALLQ